MAVSEWKNTESQKNTWEMFILTRKLPNETR